MKPLFKQLIKSETSLGLVSARDEGYIVDNVDIPRIKRQRKKVNISEHLLELRLIHQICEASLN